MADHRDHFKYFKFQLQFFIFVFLNALYELALSQGSQLAVFQRYHLKIAVLIPNNRYIIKAMTLP